MDDGADLQGVRVLVVEDDFYLATDAERALEKAGATVLGPYARSSRAIQSFDHADPDAAVLDINLGRGPTFDVARALVERGVPFIFVTGYDQSMIPPEFDDVTRLQKPVELGHIVRAVAELTVAA